MQLYCTSTCMRAYDIIYKKKLSLKHCLNLVDHNKAYETLNESKAF